MPNRPQFQLVNLDDLLLFFGSELNISKFGSVGDGHFF